MSPYSWYPSVSGDYGFALWSKQTHQSLLWLHNPIGSGNLLLNVCRCNWRSLWRSLSSLPCLIGSAFSANDTSNVFPFFTACLQLACSRRSDSIRAQRLDGGERVTKSYAGKTRGKNKGDWGSPFLSLVFSRFFSSIILRQRSTI